MPQNVQLPLIFLQHQIINGSKDFNALSFLLFLMHMMGDFVLHSVQGDLLTVPGIFMKQFSNYALLEAFIGSEVYLLNLYLTYVIWRAPSLVWFRVYKAYRKSRDNVHI